jgi:hypothetical protein
MQTKFICMVAMCVAVAACSDPAAIQDAATQSSDDAIYAATQLGCCTLTLNNGGQYPTPGVPTLNCLALGGSWIFGECVVDPKVDPNVNPNGCCTLDGEVYASLANACTALGGTPSDITVCLNEQTCCVIDGKKSYKNAYECFYSNGQPNPTAFQCS